jgi:hydroxymethylpyrimidine/phosphomethylpyrimidine kinase
VFGMTVVTSIVAENTFRVIEIQDVRPDIIEKQIDAVFEDIPPDAVKIGMLSCRETMLAVAQKLREWKPANVVIDPVMYAKNGCALMDPSAINTLIDEILPLADLITPNIPEAEKLTDMKIKTAEDMHEAARQIYASGTGCEGCCDQRRCLVVVKGGHIEGDANDILFDGESFFKYPAVRVDTKHTHGTGCTFSSAIAANLALGVPVQKAVEQAKAYIHTAISNAPGLGKGNGPVHHFFELWKQLPL